MGTHVRTKGLSRRAYARLRGCSEGAVRKAIADGRLKPAMHSDGSLDAEKADRLLAKTTIAPPEAPSDLSAARVRKLRAQCALLSKDIADAEGAQIPWEEAERVAIDSCQRVAAFARRLPQEAAARLKGLDTAEIAAALQAAVYETLTSLAETRVVSRVDEKAETEAVPLAGLDGVELAALKVNLQARRLELQRELRDGKAVRLAGLSAGMVQRFMSVRTKLLALPHRCAPLLFGVDPTEAVATLSKVVEEAIEELACELVPREVLNLEPTKRRTRTRSA